MRHKRRRSRQAPQASSPLSPFWGGDSPPSLVRYTYTVPNPLSEAQQRALSEYMTALTSPAARAAAQRGGSFSSAAGKHTAAGSRQDSPGPLPRKLPGVRRLSEKPAVGAADVPTIVVGLLNGRPPSVKPLSVRLLSIRPPSVKPPSVKPLSVRPSSTTFPSRRRSARRVARLSE